MSEQARQEARERMAEQWAVGLGNCGTCENAANGGCSIVNALAEAAGVEPKEAGDAIRSRIEHNDNFHIKGKG